MTHLNHNRRRAMRITHLLTWCADWSSEQEGLIDLLADARHWCDHQGLCFATLDRTAYQHYAVEIGSTDLSTSRPQPEPDAGVDSFGRPLTTKGI